MEKNKKKFTNTIDNTFLRETMEKILYTQKKMDSVKVQVQKLIDIVRQLEQEFPGRHFT